MTSIVLLLAALAGFSVWWLSGQGLTAKPWLQEGVIDDGPGTRSLRIPAAKTGLGVFLAVAGSLFALFISAYSMRMGMPDWRSVPMPRLLWPNTGMLIMSSVALQWGVVAARRDDLGFRGQCASARWSRWRAASSASAATSRPRWTTSPGRPG
jgi:cytochrome c oxidase subunit 3